MPCTGCNDDCFGESIQLAQGATGAPGADGLYGGWCLEWSFDSNLGSNTGSGEVRFDTADPQLATTVYVNDDTGGSATSVAADVFLSAIGSDPYGQIKIFKEDDSNVFWLATITAADDTSVPAEYAFTVTDVITNGSFTDGDDIIVCLNPSAAPASSSNILDYRSADGGVFGGGALYFPGVIPASTAVDQTITDNNALNPIQTTVPANTLSSEEDFLRVRVAGMVQSQSQFGISDSAIKFTVYWDTTPIFQINIGNLAKNNLGTQAFEMEIDFAYLNNPLSPGANMQASVRSKFFGVAIFGLVTIYADEIGSGMTKGAMWTENLATGHTISVKATNDISDGNIVDFDAAAGDVTRDQGFITSYEVIKYKK